MDLMEFDQTTLYFDDPLPMEIEHLRQGNSAVGEAMLEKLAELDSHDRLGGKALLNLVREEQEAEA
ncbi:MAG: hypothetical protein Q8Q28_07475 [Pseudomonadota bacterium]|nr:hypothetical protein [Pseudomonadota bacterium]